MDQPRKVAKPARGQLNREVKCLKKNQNAPRPSEHPPVRGENMSKRFVLADASVVGTPICTGTVLLSVLVYIPGIFFGGGTFVYNRARFTVVV